jgi:PhzF family phenazine biosynthesis protein
MALPLYKIDAFTSQAFHGNPAAVCMLDAPLPDALMQSIAAEMALSETAFLLPENEGYRLRWFTPLKEVRLCGHATLASAHILWENQQLAPTASAHFYTLSGLLTARRQDNWIELNFPMHRFEPAQPPAGLLECLGITSPLAVCKDEAVYIIELQDEHQVRTCQPDFYRLLQVNLRSVAITARSSGRSLILSHVILRPVLGLMKTLLPVRSTAAWHLFGAKNWVKPR